MDEPIACPQCGASARITERFWLDSTAGPVEHLVTGCTNHHWLTPLAETIDGPRASGAERHIRPVTSGIASADQAPHPARDLRAASPPRS